MTTVKEATAAGIRRLGIGFIRKLRAARAAVHEMRKIAEGHGKCVPPCEIPFMADYLEGVDNQLEWYLNQLHESSEPRT
jgi:hypothetical protein